MICSRVNQLYLMLWLCLGRRSSRTLGRKSLLRQGASHGWDIDWILRPAVEPSPSPPTPQEHVFRCLCRYTHQTALHVPLPTLVLFLAMTSRPGANHEGGGHAPYHTCVTSTGEVLEPERRMKMSQRLRESGQFDQTECFHSSNQTSFNSM